MNLADMAAQTRRDSQARFPTLYQRSGAEVLVHNALGLAGEAGEVANLVKKLDRDGEIPAGGHSSGTSNLAHELTDVLIYTLLLADQIGVDLETIWRKMRADHDVRFGPGAPMADHHLALDEERLEWVLVCDHENDVERWGGEYGCFLQDWFGAVGLDVVAPTGHWGQVEIPVDVKIIDPDGTPQIVPWDPA